MTIALLLVVALLLGGTLAFTSWRINRLATRRWTTIQRHLDGAIAGVGILLAAPLGAAAMVAIGYSCARPVRRGVLHGIGVLAFAATTGAATWSSPRRLGPGTGDQSPFNE